MVIGEKGYVEGRLMEEGTNFVSIQLTAKTQSSQRKV
jgi:hypothetical protein